MSEVIDAHASAPERSALARIFGKSPLPRDARLVYRAALSELLVGDMLDGLGPRWDILHVVPVEHDNKDIDHLVIGPPGVFTITTENFPGQEITVNGDFLAVGNQRFDDIAVARTLGESAAQLLSDASGNPVVVHPLLVVVRPTKLNLRVQPTGATVVASKALVHYLERLERTLTGLEIATISDVADRDSTWQSAPGPSQDILRLSSDFAKLREAVEDATQVRVIWGVALCATVAAIAWVSTAMIVSQVLGH